MHEVSVIFPLSISGNSYGNYPSTQSLDKASGNNITTKYLNFGSYLYLNTYDICGLNTRFYVTLKRGVSLAMGVQICTADDMSARDPIIVTLEGSNSTNIDLTYGINWNLIYNGNSGLTNDPGRLTCGQTQFFCNSKQYMSYRFLVTRKRALANSVQYSEVRLLGFNF
ncbi:unnamed protein product [Adineta steineri]|uniref:Uncharacterized protein n=1 Tax=Adineta steineri TaxID=433720 RepID=A0A814KQE9_9BILA|nr:unnamed protein product [Adineta steineri]